MRWSVVLFCHCLVFAWIPFAIADQYYCDAVANGARLGVYRTNAVNVAIDSGKKECRFSVNGATTGSPPIDLILSGLNGIAARKMESMIADNDLAPLANLLLAPTRFDGVPNKLFELLKAASNELSGCFTAWSKSEIGFRTEKSGMSCSVVPPRKETLKIRRLSVVNDSPQLQLIVIFEEHDLFLFVPVGYRQGFPPLTPP
jgi:hypothetical protein